jgi:hypothetical protein
MADEMERILGGNSNGLIAILYQQLPGGTEENNLKPQSGQPLSRPKFYLNFWAYLFIY